ncbi:MAG: biopolymer transporter ExbD [Candidatus Solibacter usitatus]|nr:biopolymer transporter ExbD [Candidatus Solibacter usitatus]
MNRDRTLAINSEAVRPEDLQDRLRVIFSRRAQRVLFVRGHHELAFEDIVKVIDLAKGAGIYQVGLMTEYGEL